MSTNRKMVEEEDDDDGVEVIEAICASCHAQGGDLLSLTNCSHSVHYKCCVAPTTSNNIKRQKSSAFTCPACGKPLTWLDHARSLPNDRRAFLQVDLLSTGDAAIKKSLDALDQAWTKQQEGSATRSSSAAAAAASSESQRKKHRPSSAASSKYWNAGTGFGGGTGETAVQSKAKLNQQVRNDAQISKLLSAVHKSCSVAASESEAMFRKSLLVQISHAHLNNGPVDVANRVEIYTSLLSLLLMLASKPALVPLFLSNYPNLSTDSDEEEEEGETSLLVRVAKLAEALLAMNQDLAMQCEDIKHAVVRNARHHPHFASRLHEIEKSIKRVDRGKVKETLQEALELVLASNTAGKQELEPAYKQALQNLAFRATCLIDMCETNTVFHSFVKQGQPQLPSVRGAHNPKLRMHRINTELATLRSSLPVEWNSSVFCVVDENRMDVLQFLIIGPEGTPYQNGCFVFDCILPLDYPQVPPQVVIQTTGGGKVRFNPNLYKDGKVCLSLLNTWSGPSWDPKTSTLLQVLISIQSLIMVPDPFFNEPGMENQPGLELQSKQYNAGIKYNALRLAMLGMIESPPYAFEKIVRTHFVLKKNEIRAQLAQWMAEYAACARGPYSSQLPSAQAFNAECSKMFQALDGLGEQVCNSASQPLFLDGATAIVIEEEEEERIVVDDDDDEEEEEEEVVIID